MTTKRQHVAQERHWRVYGLKHRKQRELLK
jgi:hypothetical protein